MAPAPTKAFFTRCPECGSVYHVTDEQIDQAAGRVVCGWCDEHFNALAYLSHTAPDEDVLTEVEHEQSMEFDAPEDQWDTFFVEEGPESATGAGFLPGEYEAPVWVVEGESTPTSAELDESIDGPDPGENTEWGPEADRGEQSWPSPWSKPESEDGPEIDYSLRWLAGCLALAVLLAGQFIHQERDRLAASPRWGSAVRAAYDGLGTRVFPAWDLSDYEIRAFNAVAGAGQDPVLEVNARVAVIGRNQVGYPMVRLTLNDVWAGPVAEGLFGPGDYLLDTPIQTSGLLVPGTRLPVQIRVPDPGPNALGYKVDICLTQRGGTLRCQLDQDPFREN